MNYKPKMIGVITIMEATIGLMIAAIIGISVFFDALSRGWGFISAFFIGVGVFPVVDNFFCLYTFL